MSGSSVSGNDDDIFKLLFTMNVDNLSPNVFVTPVSAILGIYNYANIIIVFFCHTLAVSLI